MKKFYTCADRPEKQRFLEINSGEQIVEKIYVNQNKRIEEMILAGERLKLARGEQYDYPDGLTREEEDTAYPDPTRHGSFDMADGSRIARNLENKRKTVELERKRKDDSSRVSTKAESDSSGGKPA